MDNHPSFFGWYRQIGQLLCNYYGAAPWPFEPTRPEYEHWLTILPDDERALYSQLGFTACQAANAFRRYWLEKREYRLLDYLETHLSRDDFQAYRQTDSPLQLHQRPLEPSEKPFRQAISNP